MKRILFVVAGLALCFCFRSAFGHPNPPLLAASFQSAPNSTVQPPEAIKTFTGTVTKQGDILVLSDRANKTNYQFDDPQKVSTYIGKAVKVTGTLDADNLTIHVQTISEIA